MATYVNLASAVQATQIEGDAPLALEERVIMEVVNDSFDAPPPPKPHGKEAMGAEVASTTDGPPRLNLL
jgi:hypothetical protein